jgi:hypothetical protein
LDDYVVRTYPEEKSKQEKILEMVQGNKIKESFVPSALQPVLNLLNGWETRQGVIARSEYLIHIE